MRVLLIQLDDYNDRKRRQKQPFPNLALMKLSAFHIRRGDEVGLRMTDPDRIYISCVFSKNREQANGVATMYPRAEIFIGGPGAGGGNLNDAIQNLPLRGGLSWADIDNIMPDYSLYNVDYSVGFTSRGCVRKCPFCLVPELEGDIREGTPIECFHKPEHGKIILLDNNFTASPTREKTLDYIQEHKLKVNFSQGLDVRLVDEGFAHRLKKTRCYTRSFKHRALHFAWDLMGYEAQVKKGIENLLNAKYPKDYLTFYVLVGYNTKLSEDLYRIHTLIQYGITPYIMIYNDKKTPILDVMDRWANLHLFRDIDLSGMRRLSREDKIKVMEAEEEARNLMKNG